MILAGCRSLAKSLVWEALGRAQIEQVSSLKVAIIQSVAHDKREPIRRLLMDEESRGRVSAIEGFMGLPEAWMADVEHLIEVRDE